MFSSNTDKDATPKKTIVHKNFSLISANLSHFDMKGFKHDINTTFNICRNTKNVNWGACFVDKPVITTDISMVIMI